MSRRKRNPLPRVDYLDRVDDVRREEIDRFLKRIDVTIKDYNLLNRALSHKSYTNELGYGHNEQYEKLEFFGDGVLGLVINEYLFKCFPDSEEGELAKIKSAVVSEASLAEVARDLDLADVILIGRGESRSGGAERPSLLADILEAVIGAIFLDQGLPAVRRFVLQCLESRVQSMASEDSVGDPKSYFQEIVQRETGDRPSYNVMRSSGPDHSRTFRIAVTVRGKRWGIGAGKSKKEAEQSAAEEAIKAWEEAKRNRGRRGRGGRDERDERGGRGERGRRGGRGSRRDDRRDDHDDFRAGSDEYDTPGSGEDRHGSDDDRGTDASFERADAGERDVEDAEREFSGFDVRGDDEFPEAARGEESRDDAGADQDAPRPRRRRGRRTGGGRAKNLSAGSSREHRADRPNLSQAKERRETGGRGRKSGSRRDAGGRRFASESREPRRSREEGFVPAPEVDDPVSWAAGESYQPRERPRRRRR